MKTMMNDDSRSVIDANRQEMHTSLGEMAPAVTASSTPEASLSSIASFYAGKSIFITGATGFMGKVLMEKLLRSCPDLDRIYILMRSKRNVEPRDRLATLLQSKIFDRVREMDPELLNKVTVIPGDIVEPGLGISADHTELLQNEVSIVFHSAATVKFDEPIKTSINYNALGTRYMLNLSRGMKRLVAFVHVSTAYSQCDCPELEERFYPTQLPYDRVVELAEWMNEEMLDTLTPQLLAERPNTYTFTKALAEALVEKESGSMPVAIVRPSIVTASWREPFPGWIDNINGPTGMVLATMKGLLRSMLHLSDATADVIPVDVVINAMIAVAWHTAIRPRPNNNKIVIYNCTSGALNPMKWSQLETVVFPLLLRFPSQEVFRYPGGALKESRFYHNVCCLVDHLVPAYVVDGLFWLVGKQPKLVRVYAKLHRAIQVLEYFTCHQWNFHSNNLLQLSKNMAYLDQKTFNFDVRHLDWSSYWQNYVLGIRRFVLKEDDSTLPEARKRMNGLYWKQKIFQSVLLAIMVYICLIPGYNQLAETMWPGQADGNTSTDLHVASTMLNGSWYHMTPSGTARMTTSAPGGSSWSSFSLLSTLGSMIGLRLSGSSSPSSSS